MHAVDGILHLGVVTLALNFDSLAQVAASDQAQNPIAFSNRQQDGVQHLVDALDDFAIIALVLRGVGAGGQSSLRSRPDQQCRLADQRVDVADAVVQVVLDLVEIAVVIVGNLRRDIALGNAVHVFGGHIQGSDHCVQRAVDAFNDLAVFALVLRGVGARRQFAFHRRLHQNADVRRHALQSRGDAVDGLLHLLVIAAVGLRDQFVDLTRTDLRQDAVALPDRQQDRIEHRVHALNQLAVVSFKLLYPPAFAEAACARGFHQPAYLLLQQFLRLSLLRVCYWTVQNGGAGGLVSAGANAPAATCLSCHSLCSFVSQFRHCAAISA